MLDALVRHGHDLRMLALPRGPTPLHAMAVGAGFEQRVNEVYSWDGRERGAAPFVVIQHTLAGEGRLDYAGTAHQLTPGRTMVLAMPHAHRYWLERGRSWEYFWLVLNGREVLRLAHQVIEAAGPVIDPPAPIVDRLAGACLSLIARDPIQPGEASHAAYGALAALHDAVFADAGAVRADLPAPLARVLAHVEHNLARPLPVDRLAGVAGMSRAHFVRRFSAATGTAPAAHVLARRMDRVERLLHATDMSVAAIAAAAGFANANYLAKAFRRRHEMTPLAYRAALRGRSPPAAEPGAGRRPSEPAMVRR